MKNILILFLLFISLSIFGQTRIDGDFAFQSDPAKKYSLYIPSAYQAGTPHRLMLALHPLNTNRWDAESWCDTLIVFAETNNLILACPDGGVDGAIDDPIDTAFTSVLLDSVAIWYDVDPEKTYAMGFSWGGKTVYTYGLNHIDRFRGFMPIGAAVNFSEVSSVIQNAVGKPYYLVHGGNDSPNVRFTPLLNGLNDNDAITNSMLMPGIGHTIDFPNRNQILTDAFIWLDSVNCAASTTPILEIEQVSQIAIFPNPVNSGNAFTFSIKGNLSGEAELVIFDQKGSKVFSKKEDLNIGNSNKLNVDLTKGIYFLSVSQNGRVVASEKLLVI